MIIKFVEFVKQFSIFFNDFKKTLDFGGFIGYPYTLNIDPGRKELTAGSPEDRCQIDFNNRK